nr:MAG TPA: hypothetical protein [Caudoviricetes sp.]
MIQLDVRGIPLGSHFVENYSEKRAHMSVLFFRV